MVGPNVRPPTSRRHTAFLDRNECQFRHRSLPLRQLSHCYDLFLQVFPISSAAEGKRSVSAKESQL